MTDLPANRPPRLFSLRRPDARAIASALPSLIDEPLSYTQVGGTETGERPPWRTEAEDVVLGTGQAVFERAADAVARWVQFDLDWVELHDPGKAPEVDMLVAFASRQLGMWAFNVCRVVLVVDERDPDARSWRYGFAYGTLASHAVQGEERFMVSWDRDTDQVRFEISKFSRAKHPLVRVAGPITWWIQSKFTRDALQRVADEVHR